MFFPFGTGGFPILGGLGGDAWNLFGGRSLACSVNQGCVCRGISVIIRRIARTLCARRQGKESLAGFV